MKFKFLLVVLISVFLAGCAGVPMGGGKILSFKITPDKGIRAGSVVSIEVKTTEDIEKVKGTIEIPGAFWLPLKYDKTKKLWAFKYMIPPTFMVPKGEFTAKITVSDKAGNEYTTTKQVSTK